MGEIWRLWSAVWLGLPLIKTKSSVLWQMPKSNKARFTENIEKYTEDEKNVQYTSKQMMPKEKNFFNATKDGTEKQQKTSVGNKKDIEKDKAEKTGLMQQVFLEKGQMEKDKWIQPAFVKKEQEEKGMSMQPVLMCVAEREKQKEIPIFSVASKSNIIQSPKKLKTEIWKNSGETKQMMFLQNQTKQWQTEKIVPKEKAKVTQFLHLAERGNVLQAQTKQPKIDGKMSEIWKQQGEDVVMLQKILRHYENQQNHMAGNQNVSIQIGHIKQEADVDDVMEALTKKLWETRSMTTKKPKGSV